MENTTVNTRRLRLIAGFCGLIIPWIVALATWSWPDSISITYYSVYATGTFMSIMGACAITLISYKGYSKIDDVMTTLAGIFCLGVCLFPMTYIENGEYITTGLFHLPSNISHIFHSVSAIIFFAILAFNSIFLFTKSTGEMTKKKKIRNVIFRVSGIVMLGSFSLKLLDLIPQVNIHNLTWIVEAIALTAFAASWLTKANCFGFLAADKD